jgi:hypothetical protein
MRAVGTIEALEKKLARPVLTANQIILWQALAMRGEVHGVSHWPHLSGFNRRSISISVTDAYEFAIL